MKNTNKPSIIKKIVEGFFLYKKYVIFFFVDINEESTALYTPLARSPSFSFISFSKVSIKLAWIVDNRLRPFYMNKTD